MKLENKQLGAYRVVALIGRGRLSDVWLANHTALNHDLALKVIRDQQDNGLIQRFESEARLLAALEHPNILPIIDYGHTDGYLYLAMPYVGGGSLQERLERQPMPPGEAFDLFEQALTGLAFAHRQGILHRDLKPGNILLYPTGRAVLADFGLANTMNLNENIALTMTGTVIGSPAYMAPEQFLGQSEARSDLYSMAVILFELLTGQPLYRGESGWEIGMRQMNDPLPLPHPAIPECFEKFFTKALQKRPAQRFADAAQMLAAFQRAVNQFSVARPGVSPVSPVVEAVEPTLAPLSGPAPKIAPEASFQPQLLSDRGGVATLTQRPEPATLQPTLSVLAAIPAGPEDAPHLAELVVEGQPQPQKKVKSASTQTRPKARQEPRPVSGRARWLRIRRALLGGLAAAGWLLAGLLLALNSLGARTAPSAPSVNPAPVVTSPAPVPTPAAQLRSSLFLAATGTNATKETKEGVKLDGSDE